MNRKIPFRLFSEEKYIFFLYIWNIFTWFLHISSTILCQPQIGTCQSIVNWHLPRAFASGWTRTTRAFAICLCGNWSLSCCNRWPSTSPEGDSGRRVRRSVPNWWKGSLEIYSHKKKKKRIIFSGTDFMIPIFASLHIWKSTKIPSWWLTERS